MGLMVGRPLIGQGLTCQIGPCSTLRVEFDYQAPTDEAALSSLGSSLHPYWRESEAQLTKKQVVLLMHDTLPQGVKSVCALFEKLKRINNLPLNND